MSQNFVPNYFDDNNNNKNYKSNRKVNSKKNANTSTSINPSKAPLYTPMWQRNDKNEKDERDVKVGEFINRNGSHYNHLYSIYDKGKQNSNYSFSLRDNEMDEMLKRQEEDLVKELNLNLSLTPNKHTKQQSSSPSSSPKKYNHDAINGNHEQYEDQSNTQKTTIKNKNGAHVDTHSHDDSLLNGRIESEESAASRFYNHFGSTFLHPSDTFSHIQLNLPKHYQQYCDEERDGQEQTQYKHSDQEQRHVESTGKLQPIGYPIYNHPSNIQDINGYTSSVFKPVDHHHHHQQQQQQQQHHHHHHTNNVGELEENVQSGIRKIGKDFDSSWKENSPHDNPSHNNYYHQSSSRAEDDMHQKQQQKQQYFHHHHHQQQQHYHHQYNQQHYPMQYTDHLSKKKMNYYHNNGNSGTSFQQFPTSSESAPAPPSLSSSSSPSNTTSTSHTSPTGTLSSLSPSYSSSSSSSSLSSTLTIQTNHSSNFGGNSSKTPTPPSIQAVGSISLQQQQQARSYQQEAYLQKYAQQSKTQQETYYFRQNYLNLCEKNHITPSQDLIRALKVHIRNSSNPFARLSVCHAELDDQHVKVIITALKNSKVSTLTEILLNHNAISDIGASLLAKQLTSGLNCFNNIVSLELFGNNMGDECCKEMANMLKTNVTLKRLKLGDNKIGRLGCSYLSEGLQSNVTLTQLHMGGNQIMHEGLQKLSELCLVNNTTLTSLGLRDNNVGAEGMKALAKALVQPKCALSDIQLKGNRIAAQGAIHLAQALHQNSSLKVLELQSNAIGAAGVQALCNSLQSNRSVHALNFNDNDLGCEGASSVATLLVKNPSITTLGLANNRIRKKGAISLAKSLGSFQKEAALASSYEATFVSVAVTGLDLGNNEIGNSGAVSLAENLKTNTVLTSLDLRCCEIHLKGILALADMACKNSTLRHLDLGSNYAKNQGAQAFAKVLSINTSLTRLCLTDNQIYHEGGEALAVGLQSNFTLRNFSYGGQGQAANRIDSQIRRIIDSIVNENKRHWEAQQQIQQQGGTPHPIGTPYPSNSQYRYMNISNTIGRMRFQSPLSGMNPSHIHGTNDGNHSAISNNHILHNDNHHHSSVNTNPAITGNGSLQSSGIQQHNPTASVSAYNNNNYHYGNHYGNFNKNQNRYMQRTKTGNGSVNQQHHVLHHYSTSTPPPPSSQQQQQQLLQQQQTLHQQYQVLPSWFTSHTSLCMMDPAKLEHRLEFLFTNKLLKAENPKFPGCFFIGNIMNTLRKFFPDTPKSLDEIELVRFAYQSTKYYVHISREMVKTQIKYIGNVIDNQNTSTSSVINGNNHPVNNHSMNHNINVSNKKNRDRNINENSLDHLNHVQENGEDTSSGIPLHFSFQGYHPNSQMMHPPPKDITTQQQQQQQQQQMYPNNQLLLNENNNNNNNVSNNNYQETGSNNHTPQSPVVSPFMMSLGLFDFGNPRININSSSGMRGRNWFGNGENHEEALPQ